MLAPLNKTIDYGNQVEALQHQTFCLEWNFTQKGNLRAISEIYTSFVGIVVDYCKYRRIYIFMLRFCQMFTKALEFIIKSVKNVMRMLMDEDCCVGWCTLRPFVILHFYIIVTTNTIFNLMLAWWIGLMVKKTHDLPNYHLSSMYDSFHCYLITWNEFFCFSWWGF
jgi:hypothetical protein